MLGAAATAARESEPLPASAAAIVAADWGWGLESRIMGEPIADGFAWQHKDRYYLELCPAGPASCEVDDWMDFTYTIDPGGSGTRLSVSTLTWGTHLTGHRVDSMIFRDSTQIRIKDGPERLGDGYYEVLLSPHLTLTDYFFTAAMSTQVDNSVSMPVLSYTFRTGPTAACTEPTPQAWRCKFLD